MFEKTKILLWDASLSWAVVYLEITSAQHGCSMDPVVLFNLGVKLPNMSRVRSNQLEESKVKNRKTKIHFMWLRWEERQRDPGKAPSLSLGS